MALVESIARFFAEQRLAPRHVLVAVSAGPDSTALLLAFAQWPERPFPITAAHVNHHLRGDESEADAAFVGFLCTRLGVPLLVRDAVPDPVALRDRGIEAAAREVRYAALRAMREEAGADLIATAHQQNDQAETLLIRLVTGTGPARLAGIQPVTRDGIVRPLLDVPREEIERWLRDRGVHARDDRMNRDPRFLRTRIRRDLLPVLEQFNPRIVEALAATARQAREQQTAVRALVAAAAADAVTREDDAAAIDLDRLSDDPWLRRAILIREIHRLDPNAREVSSADLERLARSLESLRRTSVTRSLEIVRSGRTATLRRKPLPVPPFELELAPGASLRLPLGGRIRLRKLAVAPASPGPSGNAVQRFQLPPGTPTGAFVVRNRRRGDRFRPLGSPFEKKLNDLLIDRKIPRERRDRIPLLVWNDQIVWIAGVEVSESFKVAEPWRETFEASIDE
ncbi:MAG: tRNA lysidine(34) synthetase TilS [Thermoanaerobaculia bacterium]